MEENKSYPETLQLPIHFFEFEQTEKGHQEAREYRKKYQQTSIWTTYSVSAWDYYKSKLNLIAKLKARKENFIVIETKHLFDNQLNSAPLFPDDEKGYRLFFFDEAHGVKTVKGYRIEITPELAEIRDNTKCCGYCGNQYYHTTEEYCTKCVGSEYLKKPDDLKLLMLFPLTMEHKKRKYPDPPEWLIELWKVESVKTHLRLIEERKKSELESLEKKIKNAQTEYDAKKLLIENNLYEYDNCIYYSHKNIFSFGWRSSIDESERKLLKARLAEIGFNYPYEIK